MPDLERSDMVMGTFLAQVEKHRVGRSRIVLLMERKKDRLWHPLNPKQETILTLPHQNHNIGDRVLVLIELDERCEVASVTPALPEILRSYAVGEREELVKLREARALEIIQNQDQKTV